MSAPAHVQLVCTTRPKCRCVAATDNEYSCCCRVPVAGARTCMECCATLKLIDCDTGAEVEL